MEMWKKCGKIFAVKLLRKEAYREASLTWRPRTPKGSVGRFQDIRELG
jgi:hypothetical protein